MTALVPTNIQLPTHLASRASEPSSVSAAMVSGLNSPSFKRISIRGGRFRIREGTNETVLPGTKLRTVIVGASPNTTKSYYKNPYNPKAEAEERKPDCYSNDGIRPASDAKDPQAQTCANCQHNVWGSKLGDNGNKMKSCADQKRLAIISADDNSAEPEVYLFQVTPAALKDFNNYAKLLAAKGWPAEFVITELSFDTEQAYPKIEFSFGGFVDETMVETIEGLVGSDRVREIIGDQALVAHVIETKPKGPAVFIEDSKIEYAEFVEVEEVKPKTGFGNPKPKPATTQAPAEPPVISSSKLSDDILDILKKVENDDE